MDDYSYYLEKFGEYGEVSQVNYPIVSVVGLPSVKLNEIVVFDTGDRGQVIALHHDVASVLIFSQTKLKTGAKLSRTDSHIKIPTGDEMLGHIINPFGKPISDTATNPETEETRPIDTPPAGIGKRVKITKPLTTGTALVDIMLPIGKGQRQLVLGDRKTGKSKIPIAAISTISADPP